MTGKTNTENQAEYLADIFIIRFELLVSGLEKFLSDGGAEHLHQSRVSARKTEALFDTFGHLSASGEYKKVLSEIKKLINLLGAGRESDVCMQFTEDYLSVIKIHDPAIMGFLRFLKRLSRLNRNSPAIRASAEKLLMERDSIKKFFNDEFSSGRVIFRKNNLMGYLKYAVPKLFDEILNYKEDVLNGSKRKLHKMRIKSKPLRYMLETSAEFLNKGTEKYHKDIKAFVEQAGLVHDYDVLIELVKKYRKEITGQIEKNPLTDGNNSLKIFSSYLARTRKTEFEHFCQMLEGFDEDYRKSLVNSLI